jgi:3-oxoacyl-[acyl-carrier protein] reductase
MIETGLAGRVVLVTGANSPLGIGGAIAAALAAQGAAVALAFRPGDRADESFDHLEPGAERYTAANAADGHQVCDRIRAAGGTAELFPVDLADPAAPPALLDRVEAVLGPVDILVNNAAHCEPDTFMPTGGPRFYGESVPLTAAALDAHFAVNSRAPALLMAEYHRRQLARDAGWGRVVNISTDGAPAFPTEVSYGATKNALESLSRSAAHEMAPAGITVNIVSPGPIQTGWISAGMVADIERATPLGRVGRPDDVADVVVFLSSDQARWLTGQTLHVGGGHRMV